MGISSSTVTTVAISRLRNATREWVGEALCELPGEPPVCLWLYGSTLVEARIDDDGAFELRAWLVLAPELNSDSQPVLDAIGESLPLGRLVIDDEGDVTLQHSIPPEMAPDLLEDELQELCRQADRVDDLLCERLGGTRSLDRLDAEVRFLLLCLDDLPQA
jgi:hypothetical protein